MLRLESGVEIFVVVLFISMVMLLISVRLMFYVVSMVLIICL